MHLKYVTYLILSSILLLSCSFEQDTNYFPLAEGMQWHYQVTKTTRDGVRQQKYIYISLADREVEKQTVSVRKSVNGSLFYYRETEDGLLYVGKEIQSGTEREFLRDEHLILRYPLHKGVQWQDNTQTRLLVKTGPLQITEFRIKAEISLEILIEATDETVSVPAGVFHNCIKIYKQGSKFIDAGNYIGRTIVKVQETSWYAPGVGLIKSIRKETTGSQALDKGLLTTELESFKS